MQGLRQGDRITLPNGTQLEVSEGAGLHKAVAEAALQAGIEQAKGTEQEKERNEDGEYENWDVFGDVFEAAEDAGMEGGRENDGDGFRVYAKRGATKKEQRDGRSRSGSPSLEEQQEARRKVVASAGKGGRGRGTAGAASHRGPDAGVQQG